MGDSTLGDRMGFPETREDLVRRLRGGDGDRRAAVEELAERYWKPVYAWFRLARASEDAQDLTQAFFVGLLEDDVLSRYDPGRGGFRPFPKGLGRPGVSSCWASRARSSWRSPSRRPSRRRRRRSRRACRS